jgi:AmmeMemoRadiSam system protein A
MEEVCIPPDSQKKLVRLARQTLDQFVRGEIRDSIYSYSEDPYLLDVSYGVFVSLHKGAELRGCIGTCYPVSPLYQEVIEMTEAAAARDLRVAPVHPDELADVTIELSVLSPLEVLDDPLALDVGRHGLHISYANKRGVLLPQVAAEYGWDKETFLGETCLKAGLSRKAWQQPRTQVCAFTALIIKEER